MLEACRIVECDVVELLSALFGKLSLDSSQKQDSIFQLYFQESGTKILVLIYKIEQTHTNFDTSIPKLLQVVFINVGPWGLLAVCPCPFEP
jgi:hypothetical protein